MRRLLTVGLLVVGALFAVGMLSADVRSEFSHSVSYQLDHLGDGLDRLGRVADRLGEVVDRIASRFMKRAESEVAQTVRARSSDRADEESDDGRVERRVRRQETERFTWTGSVATGETLEIKGVNGAVHAEASTSGEIEVVAVKESRRSDPADVVIEVVEHAGGVTVCAVYPSRRGRENVCAPGSEGSMNVRNNDVQVEFRIKVPANVRFVAKTVNGDVEATGLEADVVASTVNGSIDLETSGWAEASTVNGSIDATLGASTWSEGLKFNTVNGSIEVAIPEGLDADVDAQWVSGGISSDVPLTVQGRFGARSAKGVLGNGGPLLELSTVNGEIRLRETGS